MINTWQNDKTGTTESNQLLVTLVPQVVAGLIKVINIINNLKFEYLATNFGNHLDSCRQLLPAVLTYRQDLAMIRPVSDKREA